MLEGQIGCSLNNVFFNSIGIRNDKFIKLPFCLKQTHRWIMSATKPYCVWDGNGFKITTVSLNSKWDVSICFSSRLLVKHSWNVYSWYEKGPEWGNILHRLSESWLGRFNQHYCSLITSLAVHCKSRCVYGYHHQKHFRATQGLNLPAYLIMIR